MKQLKRLAHLLVAFNKHNKDAAQESQRMIWLPKYCSISHNHTLPYFGSLIIMLKYGFYHKIWILQNAMKLSFLYEKNNTVSHHFSPESLPTPLWNVDQLSVHTRHQFLELSNPLLQCFSTAVPQSLRVPFTILRGAARRDIFQCIIKNTFSKCH